jgi:hypothetical protein
MRTVDIVGPAPDNSQDLAPDLNRLMRRPDLDTAAWVGLQLASGALASFPPRLPDDDEADYEPDAKIGGS